MSIRRGAPTHHVDPMPTSTLPNWLGSLVAAICLCCGCHSESANVPSAVVQANDAEPVTPTAPARRVSDKPGAMTIADLRGRLGMGDAGTIQKVGGQIRAMDLRGTGVKDISVLKGLPLQELYLEETPVADIAALEGMPLEKLYLSNTKVTDLTPLRGMRLSELNLVGTPVSEITPLQEVEFGTLWLSESQVSDLSPLAGKTFVSLDVRGTPVSDLTPLAGNQSLRRLHIAETQVTDLTPLAGLQLDRLIFTPANIEQGLDAIREMTSLTGLDTQFDGIAPVMSPAEFWKRFDAGDFNQSQ